MQSKSQKGELRTIKGIEYWLKPGTNRKTLELSIGAEGVMVALYQQAASVGEELYRLQSGTAMEAIERDE